MSKKRKSSPINQNNDEESQVLLKIGRNLYLKPEKADVYFIFESSGERVPAHKNLLSSGSDVFDTMFYGSLKEEGDIKIVDASAEAFKEFLRFFYFNKVDLSMENVSEVMYLGKKYNVDECLRLCAKMLENTITAGNVIPALRLAVVYDQQQLRESCELIVESNSQEVLKSAEFLACDRQVLEHILKMDTLSCSESVIFEACMSWLRAASEQEHLTREIMQTHMGNLFYEIRFVQMSFKEFAALLPAYGVLFSTDEYNEILQVISGHETEPKIFKSCRRLPNWDENNVITCNRFAACLEFGKHYDIKSVDVTTFSTNIALLLGNFVCAPIFLAGAKVNIKNIEATVVTNSTEIQTQFMLDYFWDVCSVKLPKPIIIKPQTIYEIRLKFPSTDCQARRILRSTVNMKDNIVVQFHNEPKVHGKNVGVVFELGFNLLK